jgi:hypothetical protein
MSKPDVPQGVPPYTHALRVTFTFDAETITLAGVQRVAMRVPAPTSAPPDDRHAGYWLAVENPAGGVIYHIPLQDPMSRDVEVFGEAAGEPMFRVPSQQQTGSFEVLIPDLPAAARVVLHGPEILVEGVPLRTKELAAYGFDELRRCAADAARRAPQAPRGGAR